MDGISELAKMFKERESRPYVGPRVGKVTSPPPEIKITLEDGIILDKTHLVIAAHVLQDYEREAKIPLTNAEGTTDSKNVGDHGSHNHNIETVGLDGKIQFIDTLKPGDKVILIPSTNEQVYFLIDKAVTL
jgi:hypothetical protein